MTSNISLTNSLLRWPSYGALRAGLFALFIAGCTVTLVQPFDQKLFNDTEAFFKKAATVIEEGKAVSPKTDADRNAISVPTEHPGHASAFSPKYDALIVDTEALILRAMANSEAIDKAGETIQREINKIIESSLPTSCQNLQAQFKDVSLTVANYIDLKCIIVKWRADHGDEKLTNGVGILKSANWEGRKGILFETILAIQKAEGFKNR